VPSADFSVIFTLTGDWGQGFSGQFEVFNNTNTVIENWNLEFDFSGNISSFWNAGVWERDGNHYFVKNAVYNANIAAKSSIIFGCSGSPGNIAVNPNNFMLSCSEE